MEVFVMSVGIAQTNAYILQNGAQAVVVDPGGEAERIREEVEKHGLKVVGILLTHGHFDHIGAVDELGVYWDVPVYASKLEAELAVDGFLNGCKSFGLPNVVCTVSEFVGAGQVLDLAGLEIHAIFTPGHTHGHMCFYFPQHNVLISGDCLFKGGYGRYDLPTGDFQQLKASIFRLFELPEDTIVYPGHGDATSIGFEKKNNLIVNG